MRTILFRAWDKKYKCFVGLTAIRWRYNYETNPNTLEFAGYSLGSPYSESEDIEIMQYTGLKDINGKEIYEGDILAHIVCDYNGGADIWEKVEVVFEEGAFKLKDLLDKESNTDFMEDISALEVVGNIYEGENK